MVTDAAGDPFEALGDPNRRDILRLLGEGGKPVRDIAAADGAAHLVLDLVRMVHVTGEAGA